MCGDVRFSGTPDPLAAAAEFFSASGRRRKRKVFRIGTVRYNWSMSAHASQAFSIAHCTDSEDLPRKKFGSYLDNRVTPKVVLATYNDSKRC